MMRFAACAAAFALGAAGTAFAAEVASDEAREAAQGWAALREALTGKERFAGAEIADVKTYEGKDGRGKFHVVSFKGGGFVVTSGDTEIAPILAYSDDGTFEASDENPLWAMLRRDVAGRTKRLENLAQSRRAAEDDEDGLEYGTEENAAASASQSSQPSRSSKNATEWARLRASAPQRGTSKSAKLLSAGNAKIADLPSPVVSPLCETRWSQSTANGGRCFNYYTPSNYVAGCVAVTFAQLMRSFKYPDYEVEAVKTYTGKVSTQQKYADGTHVKDENGNDYVITETWTTDGMVPAFGGIYDWENMPALPSEVTTEAHRQAIGKLLRDCGMTVAMHYADYGSGSSTSKIAAQLTGQFGYQNAALRNNGASYEEQKDAMLTSFDLGSPCGVGISGHSIVSDGYGYSSDGRLYIHYNYGWGVHSATAWYTQPEPDETTWDYPDVGSIVYNIWTPHENYGKDVSVVCGSVYEVDGVATNAVSGVTVTATADKVSQGYAATSDATGRYFLFVPGGATYAVAARKGGASATRTLGVAKCTSGTVGNVRDVDLVLGVSSGGETSAPTLAHRWSFTDGSLEDAAGGVAATVCGTNSASAVTFADGKVKLSGAANGAGYLTLGTNTIPDTATVEIWASHDAVRYWSRVFDYGEDTTKYVTLCWTQGNDPRTDLFIAKNPRVNASGENTMAPWTAGREYHISMTFQPQADGSAFVRWQRRDAATGELQRQGSRTVKEFALSSLGEAAFYLGHSQHEADLDANATYDEVRVWSGVLSDAQLAASAAAGPDATIDGTAFSGEPRPSAAAEIVGGHAPTQRGRIAYGQRSAMNYADSSWPNAALGSYSGVEAADLAELDRDSSSASTPAMLQHAQLRYDGWVNVSAEQAGWWNIAQAFDDYFMFALDGDWAVFSHTFSGSASSSVHVAEGWHRFTIVCGDTYGDYGPSLAFGGTCVPMTVSVNGADAVEFSPDNFTFGTDTGAITLAEDTDWTGKGVFKITPGTVIDLAGHALTVEDFAAEGLGVKFVNSSDAEATIYYGLSPARSLSSSGISYASNVRRAKNPALATGGGLTHRWSFNGDLVDSVGNQVAARIGSAVTLASKRVYFGGNGNGAGSLVLGTNILDTTEATIEIWATQNATRNYARVFDYGSNSQNYIECTWSNGTDLNKSGLGFRRNDSSSGATATAAELAPFELGVEYYIAFTFATQSDGTTIVRFQRRDAKTGAIQKEGSYRMTCSIGDFTDPVLYIGHSQFSNDRDACASYDEVRIWNCALTDDEMAASAAAGPDAVIDGTEFFAQENGQAVKPSNRQTILGEGTATQWGKIAYGADRSGMSGIAWRDIAITNYTYKGAAEAYDVIKAKTELEKSQLRFDGWFNVSVEEVGRWLFHENMDDYFAFAIDGEWYIHNNTYGYDKYAAADLAAGWHRFTIVCGDTYGGYGPSLDGSTCALMVKKPNGSGEVPFSPGNITFGSGTSTITLDEDTDWRGEGEVVLTPGTKLDLNGHTLTVDSISSDGLAAGIVNSSDAAATLQTVSGGAQYIAAEVPESIAVAQAPFPGGFVEDGKAIRFMTYNIAYCRTGASETFDPPSVAAIINDEAPDFLALNETTRNYGGAYDFVDVPKELGEMTGLHATFGQATSGGLGVTILSRIAPISTETVPLPRTNPEDGSARIGYEDRALLICEFPDFYVSTCHFDLSNNWRVAYAPIITNKLAECAAKKPVFFMGDWNMGVNNAVMTGPVKGMFDILSPTSGVRTYQGRKATGGSVIDYIALDKGHAGDFHVASSHVADLPEASDHNPVVVDVIPMPTASALGWVHETALTTGKTGAWSKEMAWDGETRRLPLAGMSVFTPGEVSPCGTVTVDVTAAFDAMLDDGMKTPESGGHAAISISPEGSFVVWTPTRNSEQEAGSAAAWLEVAADGVNPETGVEYGLRFTIDYAAQTYSVAVNSGGEWKSLASEDGTAAFKLALPSDKTSAIAFQGSGTLASIFGSYVAVEGFAEDDAVVVKDSASVILTAAQAAWLNSCAGGKTAVGSAAAGLSAQEFSDAYLLNLDITDGDRSYSFEITDVDVGAENVTVAVTLTRSGNIAQSVNGVLKFYGAATLEAFKSSALQPLSSETVSDDDFSDGNTATATYPKVSGSTTNTFFNAKIEER